VWESELCTAVNAARGLNQYGELRHIIKVNGTLNLVITDSTIAVCCGTLLRNLSNLRKGFRGNALRVNRVIGEDLNATSYI
jgi:hypothetical protein